MNEKVHAQSQGQRAYQLMLAAACEKLTGMNPARIAEKVGCSYLKDRNELAVETLGTNVIISCDDFSANPPLGEWHHLVLLHDLAGADGTRPTGELLSFRDMKDGLVRGTKFERTSERTMEDILKGRTEDEIRDAMVFLGAVLTDGRGDLSYRIPFLPNVPFYLNIWLADDEFDATGKLLADRSIDSCLSIEDAVTAGDVMMSRLREKLMMK